MSKEPKRKVYCRRRLRPNCKVETYSRDEVYSGCKGDLQELVEDLSFIKELDIIPDPENM